MLYLLFLACGIGFFGAETFNRFVLKLDNTKT